MPKNFPFYKQLDAMDCGATCLRMLARYYGRTFSREYLREITYLDKEGVSLMGISDAAERIGFHTLAVKTTFVRLLEDIPLPCIAYWQQQHFVVIYQVSKTHVWIADPAAGKFKLTKQEFLNSWGGDLQDGEPTGVLLLLETTPEFLVEDAENQPSKDGLGYIWHYLVKQKGLLFQLFLGVILGSLLQLFFPFLMQSMVDFGIANQDISFINLVLISQAVLFISGMAVDFIRGWILLHLGTRINISLVSDFLIKFMRLPLRFFDTKLTGDLLQRIADHRRVEYFLTSSVLLSFFSVTNIVVFAIVLAFYNTQLLSIYLVLTAVYLLWITFFLRRRKTLDYKRFAQMSEHQSSLIQLINGMQEIKLHNAERQKRWEWERIQAKIFRLSINYLALDQYQHAGANFINQAKNILISFCAARAVIEGNMTLGMMVAVQYIIGQLNAPLEQLVGFVLAVQDAKISLERMNEIHNKG